MVLSSRSAQAIWCISLGGELRLAASPSLVCGSSSRVWMMHISGCCGFFCFVVLFPLFILWNCRRIAKHKLQDDAHEGAMFGNFYGGYKVMCV